ncbi:MAG: hypothetical protein HY062_17280 [Bacteroidetes bacterium]|nr:hypothetical protein [Bacteroidota bacterium]
MEKKTCFIIMPFSKATVKGEELNEEILTYIYEDIIKKAISEYLKDDKKVFDDISRFNSKIGSIVSGIAKNLNSSDLVIADLTGLNPNVMYELGVRHTLKRGTIIITQDISTLPSDLRDYLCIEYVYPHKSVDYNKCYEKFKSDLHKTIDEIFSTNKYDSPVLNYLNGKEQYWREDELKTLKNNIVVANYIYEQFVLTRKLIYRVIKKKENLPNSIFVSVLSNLLAGIDDLKISIETSILYENIVAGRSIIADLVKDIAANEHMSNYFKSAPDDVKMIFNAYNIPATETKVLNYFALYEDVISEINLYSVFSKWEDFYQYFILGLEEYIEERLKEFGISDDEVEKILSN